MRATAPGEAVVELPWLAPGAEALAALARDPSGSWPLLREDPGAVLLVVRHTTAFATPSLPFSPAILSEPALPEAALRGLRAHADLGHVDWGRDGARAVHAAALAAARIAHHLAETTGRCEPEHARVGGLLAPLGWLAVCAANPDHARDCLADPEHARHPAAAERRHWGLDAAGLARRLARRWNLPPWLAAVVGHLGLPADDARRLGASPELLAVVRAAVALAQRHGAGLRLGADAGAPPEPPAAEAERLARLPPRCRSFPAPSGVPLLHDLLALAAENRRLRDVPTLRRAEAEADALGDALREARAGEAERLHAQKLASLAEFAAGAGHEINNPLAVISGQAQFLLKSLAPRPLSLVPGTPSPAGEGDQPEGREAPGQGQATRDKGQATKDAEPALRKIIEQAQRVHLILRDLMQFARPPRPERQALDLGALVCEVVTSLADLATRRHVRIVFPQPARAVALFADPAQLRTALTCLLRNAVEAAPAEGWAGVRVEEPAPDCVEVVVEDNGPGPPSQQREHLFDPFYSGRSAGRGRGLGLPTAWRLARQHGGDVAFVALPDGPTRFVLSLPVGAPAAAA